MKKKVLFIFLCFLYSFSSFAQKTQKETYLIDVITFGDSTSEKEHSFKSENSIATRAALGETARIIEAMPNNPTQGGELKFTVKTDPDYQNYFTAKFWGSDTCNVLNHLLINGLQIGYDRIADYAPLNTHHLRALPNRFFYMTVLLPLHITKGKKEVELTITSTGKSVNRQIYRGYVHTNPYLDFSTEKQGNKPFTNPTEIIKEGLSKEEITQLLEQYREKQIEDFNRFSGILDKEPTAKISIAKYQDELRYYALSLLEPWCPAKTKEEKKKVLFRIFQVIDNYTKDYYNDFRIVTRGGHQGDWGGFLGALGEALYIVENEIYNDTILGEKAFNNFLDQRFHTNTIEGKYSLPETDWKGNALTRRAAWERALKANYDFSRARLSYIYNQIYYTYEGTWKAHEGLRIINSPFYEGKERSHQILKEALGIAPFLGEEILVGPDGKDLDLYHSLFYHDYSAFFTDDFTFIVAKGLASSKLDENGNIARRLPYGKYYCGVSENGLSRENGYVGNYGETMNYMPEWFYKTLNHKGDESINDEILKLSLLNIYARSFTRYTAIDDDNKRVMRMQQVLDERNTYYLGMRAYATRLSGGKMLHFASLEQHMVENEESYSSPEWDKYWEYAARTSGFAQQQLLDNQYFPSSLEGREANILLGLRKNNFCLPETFAYLTEKRANYSRYKQSEAGYVHPLTDFDYYTEKEVEQLKVNPKEYEQLAWTDIDCMMAVVRDGGNTLSGVFNFHNRGVSGVGKMHVQNKNFDHIVHLRTRAKFVYNDYYLRMNTVKMNFMADVDDIYNETHQAMSGEICPITYQPGIGKVVRENFEVDHPYSGFPDYLEAQYGEYIFVFNTTRPQYENEQSFEIELPAGFRKSSILELTTGKQLKIKKNKVTIPSNTAYVLKLDKDSYYNTLPAPVDFVTVLAGNNKACINWKPAAGALSYNIKRSFEEFGNYELIAEGIKEEYFEDNSLKNGTTAFYKIIPVNKQGKGWESYRGKIELNDSKISSTDWREDWVGDVVSGSAKIEEDKFLFSDVDGHGLAEGDDYMIHTREMKDAFMFVHTIANGDVEITAKLSSRKNQIHGVMMRDLLQSDTRYILLGSNCFGQIIFQNRTRDTRHEYCNFKVSPYQVSLPGYTVFKYPYVKLKRNAKNHLITGAISKDGKEWIEIGTLFTPFPQAIYTGISAAGTPFLNVEDVSIKKENKQ